MTKELEKLLTPRWRGFIRRLVTELNARDVKFAVIGAMALGKRTQRVRSTADLDLIVEPSARRDVYAAMKAAGLKRYEGQWPLVSFTDGILSVDFLAGETDPEESALELAIETKLFGVEVPIVTRTFLLWLYLLSDQPRHHDDALNVIRASSFHELRQLEMYLHHDGDTDTMKLLRRWTKEAL